MHGRITTEVEYAIVKSVNQIMYAHPQWQYKTAGAPPLNLPLDDSLIAALKHLAKSHDLIPGW